MADKIITLKQKDTGDRCLPKTVKEAIIDLEIDQEYNAESLNPQSGVAVAEAIAELPDVNNGTLTIQQNGANMAIFSANSSTNVIANIAIPSSLSSFTDDLGTNPVHTHSQYLTTHQDISGKEDKLKTINVLSSSGTISLQDNSINSVTPSGNITFNLPTITDATKFHQIFIQIKLTTVYTIGLGTSYYFNKQVPEMSQVGIYDLIYEFDKANGYWVVGCLNKGA